MIDQKKLLKEKLLFKTKEASEILDLSRGTIINMIKRKQITAVKIGRQWKVPVAELKRLMNN